MPLIFILASCNNKSAQEKLDIEKAKQVIALTRIVGIGKIIPENDIIQLSSPVNGIVQKIHKKENDAVNIGTVILELNHELEDAKIVQLSNEVNTQSAQIKVDAASVGELNIIPSSTLVTIRIICFIVLSAREIICNIVMSLSPLSPYR
jgi:multidrug efflux pump subunit AcrA (membrane-fusion protein)